MLDSVPPVVCTAEKRAQRRGGGGAGASHKDIAKQCQDNCVAFKLAKEILYHNMLSRRKKIVIKFHLS